MLSPLLRLLALSRRHDGHFSFFHLIRADTPCCRHYCYAPRCHYYAWHADISLMPLRAAITMPLLAPYATMLMPPTTPFSRHDAAITTPPTIALHITPLSRCLSPPFDAVISYAIQNITPAIFMLIRYLRCHHYAITLPPERHGFDATSYRSHTCRRLPFASSFATPLPDGFTPPYRHYAIDAATPT